MRQMTNRPGKIVPWLLGSALAFCGQSLSQGVLADTAPAQLNDGWDVTRPSDAGFDPAALDRLTQDIKDGTLRNAHAVIVERSGKLVYEQYFTGVDERWGRPLGEVTHTQDSLHDLRSVTKSVTSLLLGIALEDDFDKALNTPITAFFPDKKASFSPGLKSVTLQHVLTMTSGLEWNEMEVPYSSRDNDEIRMYYTTDPTGLVLQRPVRDKPGSRWYYNGGLTHLAAGIVKRRSRKDFRKFAEERLFQPLNIERYEWLGSSAWPSSEPPSAASGLRLRARDLAKIGSLVLRKGVWEGKQIVSPEWIALSSKRYVETIPWDPTGTIGYGLMWYPGTVKELGGFDIVRAAGNGDQRLFVVPEFDIAITVFAGNYNNFQYRTAETIIRRVMTALVDQ